ncbi:protease PrsW [Pseudonocardiaceae bacterium YIM PH 21723]|nr:protease PrsW [Pseudonocardiaceae bacterium YIM PH 21723]
MNGYPQQPPAPYVPQFQQQRRGVLGPVIGLLVLGLCGLITVGIVAGDVGTGPAIGAAFAAMLPVVPVVATFLWIDRWEPEPPRLLLFAFLWGGGFATLVALIVNSTFGAIAEAMSSGSGDVLSSVISAPIVEEGAKGLFLIGLLLFRRRELDGVVDGIVYAGLCAAGFAFTENILYFGKAIADAHEGAGGGLLPIFVIRGILSPFAHPLFTSMTGIGVGIAAMARPGVLRVIAPIGGYLVAVFLHGLWNLSASMPEGTFVLSYLLIMVPLFAGMIGVVLWQRRRERRVLQAELPAFAQAGFVAPQEVELLADLAARKRWLNAAKARSGQAGGKAVRAYQVAATELAFLRHRMARGSVGTDAYQWHNELVAALARARAGAVAVSAALPPAHQLPGGWAQAQPVAPAQPHPMPVPPPHRTPPGWPQQQFPPRPY